MIVIKAPISKPFERKMEIKESFGKEDLAEWGYLRTYFWLSGKGDLTSSRFG